jgi:hypothetical protein
VNPTIKWALGRGEGGSGTTMMGRGRISWASIDSMKGSARQLLLYLSMCWMNLFHA